MDRPSSGREMQGAAAPGSRSAIVLDPHPGAGAGLAGIALGTRVATLDGLLPVEYLGPGDRVITRSGMCRLRAATSVPTRGRLVQVAPGALGHDRPERALLLGEGTPVLIRDWRAEALFGRKEALVEVSRLLDGQFIARAAGAKTRLFALHFDAAEVIYADGVEIGTTPLRTTAATG